MRYKTINNICGISITFNCFCIVVGILYPNPKGLRLITYINLGLKYLFVLKGTKKQFEHEKMKFIFQFLMINLGISNA